VKGLMDSSQPPATLPTCPKCGSVQVLWLKFTSAHAGRNAYQCASCGLLWVSEPPVLKTGAA